MDSKLDGLGGRRFLLALLTGVSATFLQWHGRLDPAGTAYGLVIVATVAAYITGNVKQKIEELKNAVNPASDATAS